MKDDPVFKVMLDENSRLIDVVAALPEEFWNIHCTIPYTYGEYENLVWEEYSAICAYFDFNDQTEMNAILSDPDFFQGADFRRFIVDKNTGKIKRPARKKPARIPVDAFIYSHIETMVHNYGEKQAKAILDIANELHLSKEAIVTAYYKGKKAYFDKDTAQKLAIFEDYKKYLSDKEGYSTCKHGFIKSRDVKNK